MAYDTVIIGERIESSSHKAVHMHPSTFAVPAVGMCKLVRAGVRLPVLQTPSQTESDYGLAERMQK